jgi:hypothetical protein
MPAINYRVTRSEEEGTEWEALLRQGKSAARPPTRARIGLKAAAGCKETELREARAVSAPLIGKARHRGVEAGVDAALNDRARPGAAPPLTEKQGAQGRAVACPPAPDGHDPWTWRWRADPVVPWG